MAKPIDEFNTYGISNPDGVQEGFSDYAKYSFDDEKSQRINEFSKDSIKETNSVEEYPQGREGHTEKDKRRMDDNRSNSSSSVQSASSAAQAASSVASIGSSLGALAGVVASAVVTAVIVVAVFISTMTMNLSLVMAHTDSLTVQLDISGAQEEDFNEAIVATLEGKDGEYQEQIVNKDTLYLTFNNLLPGKEYLIKVKNKDKVFVEKSFFTSQNEVDKGQILTHYDNNLVVVSAANVVLKSNEFYTITAKDAQGNVVFTQDSTNPNEEFVFSVDTQIKLYFSLSVSGSTYSISELVPSDYPEPTPGPEPEPTPEPVADPVYDYSQGAWSWASDYSSATISFTEIHGLDPLVVQAEVSSEKTKFEDCENDGEMSYYASLIESYGTYQDIKRVTIPALGHDYEVEFTWYLYDDPTQVTARYEITCTRNAAHGDYGSAEVSYTIDSTGECGSDETIHYTAVFTYDGKEYKETKDATRTIQHELDDSAEVTFPTSIDDKIDFSSGALSGSPKATYTCKNCGETVEESCIVEGKEFSSDHVTYTVSCLGEQHQYEVQLKKTFTDGTMNFAYDSDTDSIIVSSFARNVLDAPCTDTSLNIPSTVFGKNVTKIANYALRETGYEIITMPNTVTEIGDYAIYHCQYLTKVTLSEGLTSLGGSAFQYCSLLNDITLPEGLTTIGEDAFANCSALEEITIPEGITTISTGLFQNCTSLASVSIPTSIRMVGASAFSGCSSITEIAFPCSTWNKPGVESIGTGAFTGCTSLQSLTIPVGAQDSTTPWFGFYFGTSNSGIEDKVTGCKNQYVSADYYYIPNSLTHLTLESKTQGAGDYVVEREFYNITTIQTIDSVNDYGVKAIGSSAFEGCTGLTSISLKGVKNFGSNAFKGCTGLTSIELDADAQSIGEGFLEGCKSLASINVPFIGDTASNATPQGTNPEKTSENFVLGYFFGTTSGSGLTAVQQKGSGSASLTTYYIPSGLTEIYVGTKNTSYNTKAGIYYGAFMNCTMVQTVHLGPYIKAITSDAFAGSGVTKLYFMATDTYQVYDSNGSSIKSYSPEALEDASTNAVTMKTNTGYLWRIY